MTSYLSIVVDSDYQLVPEGFCLSQSVRVSEMYHVVAESTKSQADISEKVKSDEFSDFLVCFDVFRENLFLFCFFVKAERIKF